jgi:ribosomal protein S18 acetylase RimI-like enzyme
MSVEIRRVGPGDEALFERVADDVFDYAVERDVLAAYLATPGHLFVVALAEGEVVGQVAAVVHKHPDLRRGVARQMLDEMFALGRSLGCAEGWVGTEHDNVAAAALYESRESAPEPFVMYVFTL